MLELGDIITFLGEYNLAEVSRKTGVKYHVIRKIVNGDCEKTAFYDPRYSDYKRLSNFLTNKGHGL